jgi:hypothetical protein
MNCGVLHTAADEEMVAFDDQLTGSQQSLCAGGHVTFPRYASVLRLKRFMDLVKHLQ